MLLPKSGKPPEDPASYRLICLLDNLDKLLEKVILSRLTIFTEGENGLSKRQFRFGKKTSTVNAIRYCPVVTVDVENAFNNAS